MTIIFYIIIAMLIVLYGVIWRIENNYNIAKEQYKQLEEVTLKLEDKISDVVRICKKYQDQSPRKQMGDIMQLDTNEEFVAVLHKALNRTKENPPIFADGIVLGRDLCASRILSILENN